MMINPAIILISVFLQGNIFLPINTANRQDVLLIQLTDIGQFGVKRKARPQVPEHYHTGIDIKRPGKNYDAEPIYPVVEDKVISKRIDGPYANIIIEHVIDGKKFWSLYEHVAGIAVKVGDRVNPFTPIAYFMNKRELNRYGWQFDHFHLEILRVAPLKLQPTPQHPERFYNSYSLICYSERDLQHYYINPMLFLQKVN